MACSEWSEENWDSVLLTIQEGNCILMLGPDAAAESVNGKIMPLTEILANEIACNEKIKDEIRAWHIDPSNLAQVSQSYYFKEGRNALLPIVQKFYAKRRGQTSDLHRNLAALPFDITVTSTPDDMLYHALIEREKDPINESYNFKGNNNEMVKQWSVDHPLIYHLYGTLDRPSSLVLAENDILEFLVAVVTKNPPLPTNIVSYLQQKGKSLLFLGFGFRHWYLRILLHVLKIQNKENRSFALEKIVPAQENDYQDTIFFFSRNEYRIQICSSDLNKFVLDLKDLFEKNTHTSSLPQDAPTVFICHASEDKESALQLYERLSSKGIRPWLDKKGLRGGDQWDSKIKETIDKETDYFVVLQSQKLEKKTYQEAYVNKEINVALDRCEWFSNKKRKFIFPVQIDDVENLPELGHLQVLDIREDIGFATLVCEIERDYERRKRGGM